MDYLLLGAILGAFWPGTTKRRWLCALVVLTILAPASVRGAGSLTIPNVIANQSGPNLAASLLDSNWTSIATYVNNREIASGTLGNRPAASISGRWYFANDQNGGTLYFDTGSTWTQVAPGVTNTGVTNQLASLTLSNDTTNPDTIIDIAAGAAASDDATVSSRILMTLTAAMTKNVSTGWAVGTGNGCLDTGSIGANKTYWIYLIERTDTAVVDVLCSLAASTPTLPSSYNKQRRIGAVLTQNNNNLVTFTQFGRYFRLATSVLDQSNVSVSGTTAVTATLSVPNGDSVEALINFQVTPGTTNYCYVSDLAANDEAVNANPPTAAPLASVGVNAANGNVVPGQLVVRTNTARSIRWRCSTATGSIYLATLGWRDWAYTN